MLIKLKANVYCTVIRPTMLMVLCVPLKNNMSINECCRNEDFKDDSYDHAIMKKIRNDNVC